MVLKLNDEKIAEYTFNDIDIGLEKFFQVKITSSMVDDFVRLSGDYNPLHTDKNFAKSNNFKSTVCHGMLLASFLSRLVGMYIPGKNGLYFSQSLNFINPGYIDDVIKPHETRSRLINGLEMLASKVDSNPKKKHGNIPL